MKIFVMADVHGALDPFDRGGDIISRCDAVLIAGDLCRRGRPADALKVIKKAETINRNIIAVPGNWDPAPVMEMLGEKGYSVHGSKIMIKNVAFFGCGGAPKSLLRTPTMFTEETIAGILNDAAIGIPDAAVRVLVTHAPPHGFLDSGLFGMHVGSGAVRDYIERNRPQCAVCGHVHESPGVEKYEDTIMVNPGSFRRGKYCIIRIDDEIVVQAGVV